MERIFHLKENGTSVKTEILAGLTTFMTMAYIIALNPNLLTNFAVGTPLWNGVFLATCIASAIGTVVMAFLANKPFVMAPGMGLNSFFAVIAGNVAAMLNTDYTSAFQAVLCIILVEGIVFLLLSIFNIRDKIVTAIPLGVRLGIGPAIGLMLMNIGLGSNVGIYAEGNGYTSPFYVMRDFFGAMTPQRDQGSHGCRVQPDGPDCYHHVHRPVCHHPAGQEGRQGRRAGGYAGSFRDLLGRLLHLPGYQPLCLAGGRILPAALPRHGGDHAVQI